jgi:hypothetical protein
MFSARFASVKTVWDMGVAKLEVDEAFEWVVLIIGIISAWIKRKRMVKPILYTSLGIHCHILRKI